MAPRRKQRNRHTRLHFNVGLDAFIPPTSPSPKRVVKMHVANSYQDDGADDPKTAFYTMPHLSSIPKAPRNPWIYRKAPSYGCSAKNWVAVGGMLRQAE